MLSAVILSAGEASRMGRLKQLLPWRSDRTILEEVMNNLLNCSRIDDELRVVIGAKAEKVRKVLAKWGDPRLKILENRDYKKGMLTSVRTGLRELPEETEYILFTLADKPLITSTIFDKIIDRLKEEKPEILVPMYQGKRGHPIIINKTLVPEVYKVSGPGGLRPLLRKYPEKIFRFNLHREEIRIDIDYYEDYLKYRELIQSN